MNSYTITGSGAPRADHSISMTINGESFAVRGDHPNFLAIREAVLAATNDPARWDSIPGLCSIGRKIVDWVKKFNTESAEIRFVDNHLFWGEDRMSEDLQDFLEDVAEATDPRPWFRFLVRLDQNPSFSSRQQLFEFMKNAGIAISQDGYILAYKAIRSDWLDWHSGTVSYKIGSRVTKKRNRVSDKSANACDHGLHVGSQRYLDNFHANEGRRILVAVDPRDVVRVPENDRTKMGVCELFVVQEWSKIELEHRIAAIWVETLRKNALHTEAPDGDSREQEGAPVLLAPAPEFKPDENEKTLAAQGVAGSVEFAHLAKLAYDEYEAAIVEFDKFKLRRLCAHVGIGGASKMKGGKPAMIDAIMQKRQGA